MSILGSSPLFHNPGLVGPLSVTNKGGEVRKEILVSNIGHHESGITW